MENLYKNNSDNTARFVLGSKGDKPLFAIGLNPSTADEKKSDPTMRKVEGFAKKNGFDSVVMLNLYPLRATNPHGLPKETECDEELLTQNVQEIAMVVPNHATILVCWGNNISMRKYLRRSLSLIAKELENKNCTYVAIGLTVCQDPKHPLYTTCEKFIDFDFKNYIEVLNFHLNH